MPLARYKGKPLTFEEFLRRLAEDHKVERVSCDGGSILSCEDLSGRRFCTLTKYDDGDLIEAQLLQQICRRLNINSGTFGVVEIL